MTKHCACGRPVTAGWTAGNNRDDQRCLICRTAELMRDFRDPMTEKARETAKRKKNDNAASHI